MPGGGENRNCGYHAPCKYYKKHAAHAKAAADGFFAIHKLCRGHKYGYCPEKIICRIGNEAYYPVRHQCGYAAVCGRKAEAVFYKHPCGKQHGHYRGNGNKQRKHSNQTLHAEQGHRCDYNREKKPAQPCGYGQKLMDKRRCAGYHDYAYADQQQVLHGAYGGAQLRMIATCHKTAHVLLTGQLYKPQVSIVYIEKQRSRAYEANKPDGAEAGEKLPKLLTGYETGAKEYAGVRHCQLRGTKLFHRIRSL